MNAHHSPPTTTLCSWTAPNRYPQLQPLLDLHILPLRLRTYCVMRLADGNLFMKTADVVGQRPPFSIFTMTYFWSESKWACFIFSLCSGMWSYSKVGAFSLHFIAHHLVLQWDFLLGWAKKQHLPFRLNSCLLCVQARLSSSAAQAKWLDSFCSKFLPVPRVASVKFCSHGSRVGEKGPAQSSLATPCITRMQMSYEAIHLLEMPPWFQFESCLQSHCVSPLLHVKEVSLCERSEGDNCT